MHARFCFALVSLTLLASSLAAAPLAVDEALPAFSLGAIVPDKPGLGSAMFKQGQPRLLNVFASWCVPCIREAPQLMRLKQAGVAIDAIAVRDTGAAVGQFLRRRGDPYVRIGDDRIGSVQAALGATGVPESYLIDGRGRIVMRFAGDIEARDVSTILTAMRGSR